MHVHKFLDPVKNFFLEFLPTYCVVVFLTEVDFSLKAHQELTPNMLKLCNLSEITDKSGSDVKNNKTENPIRRDSKSKRATRKFWTITINI